LVAFTITRTNKDKKLARDQYLLVTSKITDKRNKLINSNRSHLIKIIHNLVEIINRKLRIVLVK
jgi:hypothetical protein